MECGLWGVRFGVWGLGFGGWGLGSGVRDLGFGVWGDKEDARALKVSGLGFRFRV